MVENTKTFISEAPERRAEQVRDLLDGLELSATRLSIEELERVVQAVAAKPALFEDLVVDDETNRWRLLLFKTDNYEIKILGWEIEQRSDWHDHGGSSGSFVVTQGTLSEIHRADDHVSTESRRFKAGDIGTFGPDYVHDMVYESGKPAVSVHAYSPPLTGFTSYIRTPFGFVAQEYVEEAQPSGSRAPRVA
jgi:mannose-6-phosphate isomerase-like protein (cupin superfamily)